MSDDLYQLTAQLEGSTRGLALELDVDARRQELDGVMADFGPQGRWRFAPVGERERTAAAVKKSQQERAGVRLYELDRVARQAEEVAATAEAEAVKAPDPETAWTMATGRSGLTFVELNGLAVADELRLMRLDRELGSATVAEVRELYADALVKPTRQENATIIRYIEKRIQRGGWPVSKPGDGGKDAEALGQLLGLVRTMQDMRIPDAVRKARASIQAARKVSSEARELYKVEARIPR
jgi:hypothetical protein